jgi:hypothetical protein
MIRTLVTLGLVLQLLYAVAYRLSHNHDTDVHAYATCALLIVSSIIATIAVWKMPEIDR